MDGLLAKYYCMTANIVELCFAGKVLGKYEDEIADCLQNDTKC